MTRPVQMVVFETNLVFTHAHALYYVRAGLKTFLTHSFLLAFQRYTKTLSCSSKMNSEELKVC